jgi:RNA polymerase sigma factor (sigma-70 family)
MMSTTHADSPAHELLSLLRDGVATGLTDHELLERFASSRDQYGELAFATLVARHGPMVMNVCRRMLRNPADAEDAFQVTFLVLVKRAGAIRFGTTLGPWLYGVSVRVARRARDRGMRHRLVNLDEKAAEAITQEGCQSTQELRFEVDEVVARLPSNFRDAIVTCYLEGLTHEEAAIRLCCPVGTVRSRLARGRALLRDRLERSGLALDASRCEPLALLGLDRVQSVVSRQLIDSLVRTAARLAAGQPLAAIVPVGLAHLVAGVYSPMTNLKLTMAASLIVFAGVTAWGASALVGRPPVEIAPIPVAPDPAVETAPAPLAMSSMIPAAEVAQDSEPMTSYPYSISPEKVREYPELVVKFRDLQLTCGPVAVVPLECERGTTGVVVIGNGKFQFKPTKDETIEGSFRAVVLRFNPADQPTIIPLATGKVVRDRSATEMSKHLLASVIRHCYHRGPEVLIPAKGAIAAVLYSKEHGDLLISEAGKAVVAFSFTDGKKLYERK